jgi:hypothetical protein
MTRQVGIVDVLETPFEDWSERRASIEEAKSLMEREGLPLWEALRPKDQLLEKVCTHTEAAARMLRVRADGALENHIANALEKSAEYGDLQALMPKEVPKALQSYQGQFSKKDWPKADEAIKNHGVLMAEAQFLFHGGRWSSDDSTLTTSRPFSTSFCPQVALRNAEWGGKAYDAGRVDLMVVRVADPKTQAYAYRQDSAHGHEKEVVFASGAQLTRVRETYIGDIPVPKKGDGFNPVLKDVPAYVVEVEIS